MSAILVSASQFSTFQTCKRAWAFDKIDGIKKPETSATNEGQSIHAEVENYYLTGEPPTRPESLALLLHLPNKADTKAVPETAFTFTWPGQEAVVRGFMDLFQYEPMRVWDHKTTSSKRYFKTEADLITDPQALCYGLAARVLAKNFNASDNVDLQWTYVIRERPKTRPPHTQAVTLSQTLTMLEDGIALLNPIVSDIVQITKSKVPAAQVDPSPGDACFKYGGCPYKDRCPDYAGHKPKGLEMPDNDLLALLRAASNEPVADVALPALDSQRPPEPAPVKETVESLSMPPIDTSKVETVADVQAVVPADAQPNVSQTEPPVPPAVEASKRGRPKAKTADVPVPPTVLPTPPQAPPKAAPTNVLESVKTLAIQALESNSFVEAQILVDTLMQLKFPRE